MKHGNVWAAAEAAAWAVRPSHASIAPASPPTTLTRNTAHHNNKLLSPSKILLFSSFNRNLSLTFGIFPLSIDGSRQFNVTFPIFAFRAFINLSRSNKFKSAVYSPDRVSRNGAGLPLPYCAAGLILNRVQLKLTMLATYMPGQIRAIQTAYLIGAIQVLLGARFRLA